VRVCVQRNPACGHQCGAGWASGVHHLKAAGRDYLRPSVDDAGIGAEAGIFSDNGWVVTSVEAGGQRSPQTPGASGDVADWRFPRDHLRSALDGRGSGSYDALDTVAAIAGGTAGWAYMEHRRYRRMAHAADGWPRLPPPHDLVGAARRHRAQRGSWTGSTSRTRTPTGRHYGGPHPYDDGVLLGGIGVLSAAGGGRRGVYCAGWPTPRGNREICRTWKCDDSIGLSCRIKCV